MPAPAAAPVTPELLQARLGERDAGLLAAVLDAADVAHDGPDEGAEALARKLVAALWWRSHSPVGQVLSPDSLGDLVGRSGKKLGIDLGAGDPWEQLAVLTDALVPSNRPIDLDALPESSRKRLRRGAWRELLGLSGVGSALGSRWASLRLLGLMQGPLWRLLALVPRVGPTLLKVKGATGAVAALSGPFAVLVGLATLNSALGPRYDAALPLLVGAGLVLRNPLATVPADS